MDQAIQIGTISTGQAENSRFEDMVITISRPWAKDVHAITGVSGSGKTSVVNELRALGAFVVDADQLAREVVAPGSEGLRQVVAQFGPQVLSPDGSMNRAVVRKIVFDDPTKRELLESITHPLIAKRAGELFSSPEALRAPFRVYDIPLLFEKKLEGIGFKSIVVVSAPRAVCLERIMQRDGISRAEAEKRLDSQIPIDKKESLATHVVPNGGTPAELQFVVRALARTLTEK